MRALFVTNLILHLFAPSIFPQPPVGIWNAQVKTADGQPFTWQFQVHEDGTYSIDFGIDGIIDITGNYSTDGDKITVQDKTGETRCQEQGVYKFQVMDDVLQLKPIVDECDFRRPPDKVLLKRVK